MLITCSPMIKTWRLHQPATSKLLRRKNLVGGAHWSTREFFMSGRVPVRTSPRKRTAGAEAPVDVDQEPDTHTGATRKGKEAPAKPAPAPAAKAVKKAKAAPAKEKVTGVGHWSDIETWVRESIEQLP